MALEGGKEEKLESSGKILALEMATESPEVEGESRKCWEVTAVGRVSGYEEPTSLPQAASSAFQRWPASLGTHSLLPWQHLLPLNLLNSMAVVFTPPGELTVQGLANSHSQLRTGDSHPTSPHHATSSASMPSLATKPTAL